MTDVEAGGGGNFVGKAEASGIRAWRIMTHPFSGMASAVTGSITNSATKSIMKTAETEVNDFKKFVDEGHWSWQVLGCIGGILMLVGGIYNLLYDVLGVAIFDAVVDAYVSAFGFLSICLEYKSSLMGDELSKQVQDEFRFIYKPYGRCFLYVLFGLLMFSQSGSIVYMIIGPYVAGVGFFIGYISLQAEKDYAKMKASHRLDDTHLRSEFNRADKGGFFKRDRKLDSKEFAILYRDLLHLDRPPTINELQLALQQIDGNNDGFIDFDELKKWYHQQMDSQ